MIIKFRVQLVSDEEEPIVFLIRPWMLCLLRENQSLLPFVLVATELNLYRQNEGLVVSYKFIDLAGCHLK